MMSILVSRVVEHPHWSRLRQLFSPLSPLPILSDGSEGDASHQAHGLSRWMIRLRWLAVAVVAIVLFIAGPVVGKLPAGTEPCLFGVTGALLLYNASLAALGPHRAGLAGEVLSQIIFDCAALAALIHFSGGAENPFLWLLVLHVVNAGVALRGKAASVVAVVAGGLAAAVVFGEAFGLVSHHSLWVALGMTTVEMSAQWSMAVLGALAVTLTCCSVFAQTLAARLRQDEKQLREAVEKLVVEQTELAATRNLVEDERRRLETVIDCMGDAVLFSDLEGRVLMRNPRAERLWDGVEESIANCHAGAVRWRTLHSQGEADGPIEHPAFERNGRSYEATFAPVMEADGKSIGLVMIARDVTERIAVMRGLAREDRMSNVGKLAAVVAHEVNNPIGVIALYAQHALAKLEPSDDLYTHLEVVLRNARACKRIVGDLLTLAHPREPELSRLDLRELVNDVADSVRPLAGRKNIEVQVKHDLTGPLWVRADSHQLRQAVLNLAINGIEASPSGRAVALGASPSNGFDIPTCSIHVHNFGPAIPELEIDQLFQPFYTTKPSGTGLGLSVARDIAEAHGGRIDVSSDAEDGTAFHILLPVGDDDLAGPLRLEESP